jgi:hypothetical protein
MISDTDLPYQPNTLKQPPRAFKLQKLLALFAAVLLSAVVAGTGGYLLGSRNNLSTPLSQPSLSPQAKISATITQPSYNQFAPFLSPLPKTPSIAEIPNCTLTGHYAETANWKLYTYTKYHYSVKYPADANAVFNYKSDAPHDFSDVVYIKDLNDNNWNPNTGRWIVGFGLDITTLANYPEEFNKYQDLLKKVYESKDEYIDKNGLRYIQTNIQNQSAVRYQKFDNETFISIAFIKDNILYNIDLNKEIFPLSCQILSTFKFTDQ